MRKALIVSTIFLLVFATHAHAFDDSQLIGSAFSGDSVRVQALLDSTPKESLRLNDYPITTAFFAASQKGHTKVVRVFLDKGVNVNTKDPNSGSTVLLIASYQGHTDLVQLLLEKGADVNSKDTLGRTPLMGAAFTGKKEIVKALLEKSARVDPKNIEGKSAIDYAKMNGHIDIVRLLESDKKSSNVNLQKQTKK